MDDKLKNKFLFYNQEQIIIRKDYTEKNGKTVEFGEASERNYFSIYYCINGKYCVNYNGKAFRMNPGDMIIADYDTDIVLPCKLSANAEVYILDFLSEGVTDFGFHCTRLAELYNNSVLKNILDNDFAIPKDWYYHDENGDIKKILDKVYDEYSTREFGYLTALKLNIQSVLLTLLRELVKNQKGIGYSYYVQHVVDYIKTNYNKQITLTEISLNFGYSLSYISNRFKSEVGMPFVKYLQTYRIHKAAAMIRMTDYSISMISEAVGLYNLKYFEEKFREIVGITPIKYRKMYKKNNPIFKDKQ